MLLQFKNAEVAQRFESDFDKDPAIHLPTETDDAGKSKGNGYKGPLSAITVNHAERLIAQESNLVREKSPAVKQTIVAPPKTDTK